METATMDDARTAEAQQPAIKRRAACDECRTKKLKCAGEQPACSRCVRENIPCIYSPQKQMGRPKKWQRTESGRERETVDVDGLQPEQSQDWNSMDMGGYGSGDMQPWLPTDNGADAWRDFDEPGLTPDHDTCDSPPMLNLPPELQQPHTHPHDHRDASTALLLDPSLIAQTTPKPTLGLPSILPTCACLSTLYLTLNSLQSMNPTFPFPFALHPLREAMQTAAEVLACEQCPKAFISAVQNTQLVGTLLTSIAERFARVLEGINTESERAETAGETKKFRLADLNTSTSHLHTGGLGCAAAFSIDLSPREWRTLAKKVVRAEVHGPAEGNECCPFFLGVTRQMTERQERWHSRSDGMPADCPKDLHGMVEAGRLLPREEHMCFKLAAFAERLAGAFDWS